MKVGRFAPQNKQIDLGITQGGVLIVTLFLVAINVILGELGNGIDGSLCAEYLPIYIKTRNQRLATRAQKETTKKLDAWTVERELTFSKNKTVSMMQ